MNDLTKILFSVVLIMLFHPNGIDYSIQLG